MGGCVPSETWLLNMSCTTFKKMRNFYDSECLKRAKSSKILAIDASYKVPKWMMKWGGGRIYDTLHSGTNEYNKIILQRFSTSDNHEELGSNLKTLQHLGLNPHLCFSDDPKRDEGLLKSNFSNLHNIYDIDDEQVLPLLEADKNPMTTTKRIVYLHNHDNALAALSQFRQDIDEGNTEESAMAFDTEWPVYFDGGRLNLKKTKGNINIVTLGSSATDYTIILELYNFSNNNHHLRAIGQKLRAIFFLNVKSIAGCYHKSDYTMLRNQMKYIKNLMMLL